MEPLRGVIDQEEPLHLNGQEIIRSLNIPSAFMRAWEHDFQKESISPVTGSGNLHVISLLKLWKYVLLHRCVVWSGGEVLDAERLSNVRRKMSVLGGTLRENLCATHMESATAMTGPWKNGYTEKTVELLNSVEQRLLAFLQETKATETSIKGLLEAYVTAVQKYSDSLMHLDNANCTIVLEKPPALSLPALDFHSRGDISPPVLSSICLPTPMAMDRIQAHIEASMSPKNFTPIPVRTYGSNTQRAAGISYERPAPPIPIVSQKKEDFVSRKEEGFMSQMEADVVSQKKEDVVSQKEEESIPETGSIARSGIPKSVAMKPHGSATSVSRVKGHDLPSRHAFSPKKPSKLSQVAFAPPAHEHDKENQGDNLSNAESAKLLLLKTRLAEIKERNQGGVVKAAAPLAPKESKQVAFEPVDILCDEVSPRPLRPHLMHVDCRVYLG